MKTFNPSCGFCKSTGWVVAHHRELIGVYGFRCSCAIGQNYSDRIPVWGLEFAKDFTPDADGSAPVMVRQHQAEAKKEPVKFKTDFRARAAGRDDDEEIPF